MHNYNAYLFDWDGTLVRANEMWIDLIRDYLRPRGIDLSDDAMTSKILGRFESGMRELGFSDDEVKRIGDEIDEAAKRRYPLIGLYPQAHEVLVQLKSRGKKLALVTKSLRDVVEVALTAHKLSNVFDVTVMGDEVEAPKPHPQGIEIALEKLGVAKNRAIMIGDSPKDLLAAKNAGIDSLLFYPPEHASQHNIEELRACQPTYTINSWRQLLDQLQ